jgi:ABC-2 type transport system ATP-binding protein
MATMPLHAWVPVLRAQSLRKAYGRKLAVADIDFAVELGSMLGLLGPNGAGKTTVLSLAAGLQRPDAGLIELFGIAGGPGHPALRARVGFLQEKPRVYPEMSGRAYLRFFADIYGIDRGKARVDELLDRLGLSDAADRPLAVYSRGMQQRACLARTLLHDPELLVLDEPTLGLDPRGVADMRDLVLDLNRRGKTLIISSHQLADIERVCTDIMLMDRGRIVAAGRKDRLLPDLGDASDIGIEVDADAPRFVPVLARLPGVQSVSAEGPTALRVKLATATSDDGRADRVRLSRALGEAGAAVLSVKRREVSLEDLFLELTRPAAKAVARAEAA